MGDLASCSSTGCRTRHGAGRPSRVGWPRRGARSPWTCAATVCRTHRPRRMPPSSWPRTSSRSLKGRGSWRRTLPGRIGWSWPATGSGRSWPRGPPWRSAIGVRGWSSWTAAGSTSRTPRGWTRTSSSAAWTSRPRSCARSRRSWRTGRPSIRPRGMRTRSVRRGRRSWRRMPARSFRRPGRTRSKPASARCSSTTRRPRSRRSTRRSSRSRPPTTRRRRGLARSSGRSAARVAAGRGPIRALSFGRDGHNLMRYRPEAVTAAILEAADTA